METSRPTLDQRIEEFPAASHEVLRAALLDPAPCAVIDAASVQVLLRVTDFDIDQLMLALIGAAETYSVAPISQFYVGSVAWGLSGAIYLGANMEFRGHVLNASIHAEQAAVTHAWLHGETGLQALAIGGLPCGHCRQFVNELSTASTIRLITPTGGYSMAEALPDDFGPKHLGNDGGFMQPEDHGFGTTGAPLDNLETVALHAASASYAPYSGCHAGVAVRMSTGSVYRGAYIENAAFNPSLSPLHPALIHINLSTDRTATIDRVVLVEQPDAAFSHVSACQAVLDTMSSVAIEVNHAVG